MNSSEQRLLNRFLEKVRKTYGKTDFAEAYETVSDCYGIFLTIKDMVNNNEFSSIAQKEIDKAYSYAHSLSYKFETIK